MGRGGDGIEKGLLCWRGPQLLTQTKNPLLGCMAGGEGALAAVRAKRSWTNLVWAERSLSPAGTPSPVPGQERKGKDVIKTSTVTWFMWENGLKAFSAGSTEPTAWQVWAAPSPLLFNRREQDSPAALQKYLRFYTRKKPS